MIVRLKAIAEIVGEEQVVFTFLRKVQVQLSFYLRYCLVQAKFSKTLK